MCKTPGPGSLLPTDFSANGAHLVPLGAIAARGQGDVMTVIFGVLIGAMSAGQMTPGLTAFGLAREACYDVYSTLDRVPPIDSASSEGARPDKIEGRLEFQEASKGAVATVRVVGLHRLVFARRHK